jgi:hypothetical protein
MGAVRCKRDIRLQHDRMAGCARVAHVADTTHAHRMDVTSRVGDGHADGENRKNNTHDTPGVGERRDGLAATVSADSSMIEWQDACGLRDWRMRRAQVVLMGRAGGAAVGQTVTNTKTRGVSMRAAAEMERR